VQYSTRINFMREWEGSLSAIQCLYV
jgi:hypothetical protein